MTRTWSILLLLALAAGLAAVAAGLVFDGRSSDEASSRAPAAPAAAGTDGPSVVTSAAPTTRPPAGGAPVPSPPTSAAAGPVAAQPFALPPELEMVTAQWPIDWSRRIVELDELRVGLLAPDPRDVIRPLDSPAYESVEQASAWLDPREPGVLFTHDAWARFYPLRILTAHEVVNDEIGGFSYVVTYCPLCNTAVAFPREVDGEVLRFGVSGLLRNSDLVMWDDRTNSLWQQTSGLSIVGEYAGTQLTFLPTALVRWQDFREAHPDGEVLSRDTGFPFDYGRNGYVGYSSRSAPYGTFYDGEIDDRFRALDRVVGVRAGGVSKAYPFPVISQERVVNDVVGGEPVTVWWGAADTADPLDGDRVDEGRAIGTGVAFIPVVDGRRLTFDAAGDDTFTDRETGSTWTILGDAVAGPLAGSRLALAVHQNEFWFAWSAFNAGSPVYEG